MGHAAVVLMVCGALCCFGGIALAADTPSATATATGPTNTPTPTWTATATPTCAPTGTPYCAEECVPCPTVRPDCPSVACGYCIENPTCAGNEVCLPQGGPIGGCCSCATVTPTLTLAEPTSTPTNTPRDSVTPTLPVPCIGDCDGNLQVTVDELVMGVRIALEQETVDHCMPMDVDGNGAVAIDELVRAVMAALEGC